MEARPESPQSRIGDAGLRAMSVQRREVSPAALPDKDQPPVARQGPLRQRPGLY